MSTPRKVQLQIAPQDGGGQIPSDQVGLPAGVTSLNTLTGGLLLANVDGSIVVASPAPGVITLTTPAVAAAAAAQATADTAQSTADGAVTVNGTQNTRLDALEAGDLLASQTLLNPAATLVVNGLDGNVDDHMIVIVELLPLADGNVISSPVGVGANLSTTATTQRTGSAPQDAGDPAAWVTGVIGNAAGSYTKIRIDFFAKSNLGGRAGAFTASCFRGDLGLHDHFSGTIFWDDPTTPLTGFAFGSNAGGSVFDTGSKISVYRGP